MKNILIIGAGKRVFSDVIPALLSTNSFKILHIYARSSREEKNEGQEYKIINLESISQEDVSAATFIYVCVPPRAITLVLYKLSLLDIKHIHLIIDTPISPWRYPIRKKFLKEYLQITIAEDIVHLPWIPVIKKLFPKPEKIIFEQSAYRYHGIALIKTLLDGEKLRGRLKKTKDEKVIISLLSRCKTKITITEPRDYQKGFMSFAGGGVTLTDNRSAPRISMYPIFDNGYCSGVQIGPEQIIFSKEESLLIGPIDKNATLTSLTLPLKRVGLRILFLGLIHGVPSGRDFASAVGDVRLDEKIHYLGRWLCVSG